MDGHAYWSMITSWPLVAMTLVFNILRKQFETRLEETLVEHTDGSVSLVSNLRTRDDVEAYMNSNPISTPLMCLGYCIWAMVYAIRGHISLDKGLKPLCKVSSATVIVAIMETSLHHLYFSTMKYNCAIQSEPWVVNQKH